MLDGMDIDNCRSYATEANLEKAVIKFGLADVRPLVVCNRKGRFTAIFSLAICEARGLNGALPGIPNAGFMLTN